jgi:predicted DsbA family dithiol-disulfide isomerase
MLFTIDVYSDPICPWCYIGKRRLERALKSRPDFEPLIRWRAFQLNPAMPAGGMDRKPYLAAKFGSTDEAHRLYEHIGAIGAREEIDFKFTDIQRTPNTIPAHSLIQFAAEHGKCDEVVEALFFAFFKHGRDIGDSEELLKIAAECGLEAAGFKPIMASENAVSEVQREDLLGRRIGIDGVPFFIIDEKYALSGAQEPEAFYNIFDLVIENARTAETAEATLCNL